MPVPDLAYTVEIAFSSTWRTAAASRVWTDVSAYVEFQNGISIKYGRQDERTVADANTLTLTLDNSDGRFTWGNGSSPYSPNIKLGRPIRVTATVGGSTTSVRFVGFIDSWTPSWSGGSTGYSTTTVTATSRLAWLGRSAPVANAFDAILSSGTYSTGYYWPATEATGATAALEQRSLAGSLAKVSASGVEFGVAGLDDGRPGIRLFNNIVPGQPLGGLSATLTTPMSLAVGSSVTLLVFYELVTPGAATGRLELAALLGSGTVIATLPLADTGYSTDPETQVGTHSLALTITRQTSTTADLRAYLDGVQILAQLGASVPTNWPNVDTVQFVTPVSSSASEYRETIIGRVALIPSALSAATLADLTGGINGFPGDTPAARLTRLADAASIPSSEVSATSYTSTTMSGFTQTEQTLVALIRRTETTEAGVLYDDRTGVLRAQGRSVRYQATTALTIDATSQRVGADYSPKVDTSALVNLATAKNADGTVEATFEDATSRTNYGDFGATIETDTQDLNEPYTRASWIVNASDDPQPRAPSVTTDVAHWIGDGSLSALLGLDVGSKIGISNLPAQAPSTSPTYFVEGYAETMRPGSWRIGYNLSPTAAFDAVLVLDSGTRGLLDTNTLGL